ncbi:hypothetical protein FHETE_1846 [Fusarium heterosporum]|uniref:Uncharacterized protein n=1 Tax=Fusarium heterosporum TaxID=42747 RepID=A0A8H5TS16_FUSHE|nr:hypothetical protein FHETE_1846 [Fusarium heterosporum]
MSSTATTEHQPSKFLKLIAVLDLIIKAITMGAVIGILVLLTYFNDKADKLISGEEDIPITITNPVVRVFRSMSG